MRTASLWALVPALLLVGCDPEVIVTNYQSLSITIWGPPADLIVDPSADPFTATKNFEVTLAYFEDDRGLVPYASTTTLPEEFKTFAPVQKFKFAGTKQTFSFGDGQLLNVPRISEAQNAFYVRAEILGLSDADQPVARARCPLIKLGTAGNGPATIECKAFFGMIGRWNKINAPAAARHTFGAAALPDGRVLIAGGRPSNPESSVPLKSVEIYDPNSPKESDGTFGNWTTLTSELNPARFELTATATSSGSVVLAGGKTGDSAFSAAIDIFDGLSGTMRAGSSTLLDTRSEHAAALLGSESVLVVGGKKTANQPNPSAELLTPSTAATSRSSGQNRSYGCLVQVRSNELLSCGGGINSCEIFKDGTFAASGVSRFLRKDVKCAAVDGAVFLVGGVEDTVPGKTIEVWRENEAIGVFNTAPRALVNHAIAVANGKVVVSGGIAVGTTEPLKSAFWFDPKSGDPVDVSGDGQMSVGRASHRMVGLPDGTVMAIGGKMKAGDTATPGAEIFVVPDSAL